MVVVPSSGHRDIAAAAAPYCGTGRLCCCTPAHLRRLNSPRCCWKTTARVNHRHEAETFIYAAPKGQPRAHLSHQEVRSAGWHARHQNRAVDAIRHVCRSISTAETLKTGLNNMGAVFHPTITLLNAGWIETTHGDFEFYIDGVSPSVAKLLETVDRERCTVASSVGIRARTGLEWLAMAYDARGENLHDAIHNQSGYYGIKAPPTLNHRYLFEDVPMSLTDCCAGRRYGMVRD